MPRSDRLPPRPSLVALALLLPALLLGGIGVSVAQQTEPISPATGHASVIAHGTAALPDAEVAWRVTYRDGLPGDEPGAGPADPAFLVGESGAVLVTEGEIPMALLLAGEALFAAAGADTDAQAIGSDRGAWFEIALPTAAEAEEHGDGIAVFAGAPFAPPAGVRDLDLIRDVLGQDETTTVIGQESPVLLLATGGILRVEATDGSSATLRVGEAATFGGDVVVTGDSAAPASFVAAVAGIEVDAVGLAATPVAAPATPVTDGGPAGVGGPGVISATLYGCPPGVRPRQASPDVCPLDPEAVELELVALDSQPPRLLGGPEPQDQGAVWSGLPVGAYAVRASGFGEGFDRILVPAAKAVRSGGADAAGAESGYEIVLADSTLEATVAVYALAGREPVADAEPTVVPPTGARATRPAATPTSRAAATPTPQKTSAVAVPRQGSISLRVWSCPDSLATFDAARCVPAAAPYDVSLAPEAGGAPLQLVDANPEADGEWVWEGVAFGGYLLQQPLLAPGAATYYLPDGALLADNSGYRVALDPSAPTLALELYNLAPAFPSPPLAPTAVVLPPPTAVGGAPPVAGVVPPPTVIAAGGTGGTTSQSAAPAPTPAVAAPVDRDGDSLTDDVEIAVWGTDPGAFDTDGDGVGDGDEALGGGDPVTGGPVAVAPVAAGPGAAPQAGAGGGDTDGDGLSDADEAALGTGVGSPDSDGDGWIDGNEADLGTNPLDPASLPQSAG